jgi:CYTH domain-containing protein
MLPSVTKAVAREIERKFLVRGESWRAAACASTPYRQGYLSTVKERTVRVRIAGAKAYLTVKGVAVGASRDEFEYEIPLADARYMLEAMCEVLVEKTRWIVPHEGHRWEVDEFGGANAGLVVAEIELEHEDEAFARPDWVGEEVTHDPRYSNANLARAPWRAWGAEGRNDEA